MSDHVRLRILKGITAALEAMSPAGGYSLDMGGRVFRGRSIYGSETEVPFISILEDPEQDMPVQKSAHPSQHGTLKLVLQGWVEDETDNPLDAVYGLLADVKRALYRASAGSRGARDLFGGTQTNQINGMSIGRGVVRPPDETSPAPYFWLPVAVDYVENLDDPFS